MLFLKARLFMMNLNDRQKHHLLGYLLVRLLGVDDSFRLMTLVEEEAKRDDYFSTLVAVVIREQYRRDENES